MFLNAGHTELHLNSQGFHSYTWKTNITNIKNTFFACQYVLVSLLSNLYSAVYLSNNDSITSITEHIFVIGISRMCCRLHFQFIIL